MAIPLEAAEAAVKAAGEEAFTQWRRVLVAAGREHGLTAFKACLDMASDDLAADFRAAIGALKAALEAREVVREGHPDTIIFPRPPSREEWLAALI